MLLTLHKGFNKSPVRFSTLNERIRDNGGWGGNESQPKDTKRMKCDCSYNHAELIFKQILAFVLSLDFVISVIFCITLMRLTLPP